VQPLGRTDVDAVDGAAAGTVLSDVLDVDEIPQGQVAVGKDEEDVGMELVQGMLDDGPLNGAGQRGRW